MGGEQEIDLTSGIYGPGCPWASLNSIISCFLHNQQAHTHHTLGLLLIHYIHSSLLILTHSQEGRPNYFCHFTGGEPEAQEG